MGVDNVLNAAEVQAAQNLIQQYAFHVDAGRADDVAALFTADAVWDGDLLGFGRAEGADAIAAHVCAHFRPDRPMMHLAGPAALESTSADEIRATCWCLATRWTGEAAGPYIHFYYDDVIVRGDDSTWRFRSRLLRPAFPTGN
jgi:hypothetical protein